MYVSILHESTIIHFCETINRLLICFEFFFFFAKVVLENINKSFYKLVYFKVLLLKHLYKSIICTYLPKFLLTHAFMTLYKCTGG